MKPTTLDAIRMHRSDPDAVVAAGELVDLRFVTGNVLSLRAAKLFVLLIQQAGIAVADQVQHRVPYAVLNESFHLSKDELVEAIAELQSTVISIRLTSRRGRDYVKSGPILSDVEREAEDLSDAEVRFEFSPTLRRVIADSTHWTAVSRRAVLAFESKYALKLYLYLSLRARLRKTSEDLSLDELREVLGLSAGTLSRWQDLRRFALDVAFAEVNHLAGFHAAWSPRKAGRRVVGVRIAWSLKDRDELVAAAKELDRPRVGRVARRSGLVETIADERRRIAESLASAPVSRTRPDQLGHTDPSPLAHPRPTGEPS
jgi:Initiator Replication protein